MESAISESAAQLGSLDIVTPKAGISEATPGRLHEMPREDRNSVIGVNRGGVCNTLWPAPGQVVRQGNGKVMTIGSMFRHSRAAGIFPRPAYSAAKGAVVNQTREPAQKNTDFMQMKQLVETDELKGTAVCPAAAATDCMTGNMLVIDCGIMAW